MGCEGLEEKLFSMSGGGMNAIKNGKEEYGESGQVGLDKISKRTNNHPTVKPIALMEYLIKMITPKGGVVLDPFSGSFSTGVACIKNGFSFIGIEMEEEYIKIGKARMEHAQKERDSKLDF
jgi:site-specific DNA-methyltransferase (adenine-specific)